MRPRPRVGRDGGTINPTRFLVGPLAYLLKNRFYIGEVVYRGEVHSGEQQPIVDRELFEAVQAKLRDRAVTRKLRQSRSPSFLSGLLFDDRGNLMSPSHANKKGVRYRYYVSQAVLQNRKEEAGSIARVAATDIEELVIAALRHQVGNINRQALPVQTCPLLELSDRDLVALHVERIVLGSRHIDVTLRGSASPEGQGIADASSLVPSTLHLPWTRTNASARKGIARKPSAQTNLDPAASEMLLIAIARARSWMNDLSEGRVNSFEGLIRLLGARRFEAQNLELRGRVLLGQGRRTEAESSMRQSLAISREIGLQFSGPKLLGALSRAVEDSDERDRLLVEAEQLLLKGSLGHNHLWFYRDAIEAMLVAGNVPAALRYADLLEAYAAPEPLPWTEIFLARGRALARAHDACSDDRVQIDLAEIRAKLVASGLRAFLPPVDAALAHRAA